MRYLGLAAWLGLGGCTASNAGFEPAVGSGSSSSASGIDGSTMALGTGTTGTTAASGASDDGAADGPTADGSETSGGSGGEPTGVGETDGPPTWVFTEGERVAALSVDGFDDDDPSLRVDMLEVLFASTRDGDEDIYVSTRPSLDAEWDVPVALPSPLINRAGRDSSPELLPDGLTMTLSSDRAGSYGDLDIWVTTRDSWQSEWAEPEHLAELNGPGVDGSAALSDDLTEVFFCSIRDDVGNEDLFWSGRRSPAMSFDPPLRLGMEINSDTLDCNPWWDAQAQRLLFATSDGLINDSDLVVAEREGGVFGPVVRIEGVNTSSRELDPWLSPDGSELYFARLIPNPTSDIYRAVRVER
ncbi:MAG: hypothetical protein AB1Z98_29140 [Nannocystaceae bacterium]